MRKNVLVAGALVLAAAAVTPFVRGAETEDRPPGVAPEAWIPLNERIGMVISSPLPRGLIVPPVDKQGRPQPMLLGRMVPGYLMVEVEPSIWARVVIVEPARAQPAHSPGAAD